MNLKLARVLPHRMNQDNANLKAAFLAYSPGSAMWSCILPAAVLACTLSTISPNIFACAFNPDLHHIKLQSLNHPLFNAIPPTTLSVSFSLLLGALYLLYKANKHVYSTSRGELVISEGRVVQLFSILLCAAFASPKPLVLFSLPTILHYLSYGLTGKSIASQPDGPLPTSIKMRPQNYKASRSPTILPNHQRFRFLANASSHAHTNALLTAYCAAHSPEIDPAEIHLTGEPTGRAIWSYTKADDGKRASITAPLALGSMLELPISSPYTSALASSGLPSVSFDVTTNPNSADKIYRSLVIEENIVKANATNSSTAGSETAATHLQSQMPASLFAKFSPTKNPATANPSLPSLTDPPTTPLAACRKAIKFYSLLQLPSGHWSGDYGGPLFLLPGLVIVLYILTNTHPTLKPVLLPQFKVEAMIHYMLQHQQDDGGWGTHIEGPATMFGTTMQYIALRLLGVASTAPPIVKARSFLHAHGGALYTASWCKFYLCILGLMPWIGHSSVPPEMFLLPNWFPFHPGRMWCHARMVYLPMSYLFGSRFVYGGAATDPLISELREELYTTPYELIDFGITRHYVADIDNYSPLPAVMRVIQNVLQVYETSELLRPVRDFVRSRGLKFAAEYMKAEDLQTNYINIGPVSKVLNMLSTMNQSGCGVDLLRHVGRIDDYLWVAEDGMKMQGYNGSQCWDTSFAIQGIHEAGLLDEFPEVATLCYSFFEKTQILETPVAQGTAAFKFEASKMRDKYYRHVSQGGWPFSTSAHGWPISDCTGEGLKAVLALHKTPGIMEKIRDKTIPEVVNFERLCDSVNVILELQNTDGGFATYENNRGYGWYEYLNPSEVFGDIMIDYSYVECTMASVTALADFRSQYPEHRKEEVARALDRASKFMKLIQRSDGSWYGSWACCFAYAAWFGIEGLVACGETGESKEIIKACEFLKGKQCDNGGWGEDFRSCYNKSYAEGGMERLGDEQGACVVNTAWAVMALVAGGAGGGEEVKRGVEYLMARQLDTGDWPQEGIAGVFNRTCGITYTAYRNVFPIWALGRYIKYKREAAAVA